MTTFGADDRVHPPVAADELSTPVAPSTLTLGGFDESIEVSDRIIAAAVAGPDGLAALSKGQDDGNRISLRWILCHLVEEYARHNGHADFLRESIDGSTGE